MTSSPPCDIVQLSKGKRQRSGADNARSPGHSPDTSRWHQEQNLPVVMLISTNLFKRVVSALRDKPSDGDKGAQAPTCRKASSTENSSSRSCLSARGQLQRVWQDRSRRETIGLLTWKQARAFYGYTVRVVQRRVLYVSAGGPSNRKEGTEGQK